MKRKLQLDIEQFFQKKLELQNTIQELEKKIYDLTPIIDKAKELAHEMETIAKSRKSYYFQHRTQRLLSELQTIASKKGYTQKEFQSLYQILNKIKEEDNVYFLDQLLRSSFQKLSQNLKNQNQDPYSQKKIYFTFQFRGVHFMAEKMPMKIIRNVNPKKSYVRIGRKRFPIYPGPDLGIPDMEWAEPTNLCILKSKKKDPPYRCFFFHKLEHEILFDESTVRSRMVPVEENLSPYVKYFFRYRGILYYILEWNV